MAESLRLAVEGHAFSLVGWKTVSIGATTWVEGDTGTRMVARADEALYKAKNSGRNCVCIG